MADLDAEGEELTNLVRAKVVTVIRRHMAAEVLVEFEDGTRLFINSRLDGLEFSVTG